MNENRSHFTLYGKSPLLQLVVALLIAFILGGAIFLVLFLAGLPFSGIDFGAMSEDIFGDIGDKDIMFFRYLLIVQSISFLLIPAIMVRRLLLPDIKSGLNDFNKPNFNEIAIVVLLAFCILPVNGIAGEINSAMKFPEWLSGLEEWMRSKEDEAADLIGLLLTSDSGGVLFLNLFIIAILPAISEELFFRGVLQRIFYGFFRSPHTAIWLTAILFSAIHLQFYGFVPRLILGLSFGYLYYWGRTLWLPLVAHFVNNATAVAGEYLQGSEPAEVVSEMADWTRYLFLPAPLIISVIILLYFRHKFEREKTENLKITEEADQAQF
ncbi:MAG: CPBP family intramembrane metalloprotease [Bacteroidales bacterium]|nr:CPBP family intramembrane metalloprotease [Bacteroidales bacterium]